jgi:hypothetical protein
VPVTQRLLAILLGLALLAPTPALGQSAGDEQYVDPFQDTPGDNAGGQSNSGSQGGQGGAGSQGGGEAVAPPAEPAAPEGAASVEAPATQDSAPGGDGLALPRTGLPAAVLGLIGLLVLAGGVTLRRAT